MVETWTALTAGRNVRSYPPDPIPARRRLDQVVHRGSW